MEDSFNAAGCLSFFTANHARHDKQWLQKGSHLTLGCFACFVEIIENKNEPSIRKSRILQELLNLISAGNILKPLAANDSVVSHLITCLWEVMEFNDNTTSSQNITVIEIIYQLCCSLKCEALVGKVMEYLTQKLIAAENIKKVSPQLDLLGKLLQKIPGLTKNIVHHRQNLLACITKASAFPDEGTRSSVFFILTHLYRDKDCCQVIPLSTTEIIFRECCQVLTSATSKELQINSIALLQSLTRPENLPKGSQTITSNIERVTTSLKKAFLSREDLVKSLAIGCLDNLVSYDEKMIDSDLTGFLFEVFKTKNESLLALGFQCVSQLVEKKALYTKGHVLYGFETIVSALMMAKENRNSKLIKQGLGVFAKVLGNCPNELSLINSKKVLLQCLDVISSGLCSLDDAVFLQACSCFSSFLESRHFTCDVPYDRLMALIEPLARDRLQKVCKSTRHWDQATNKDLQSSTIDAILEVFKKSLDLALCGQNEPATLEALLVSQEDNTRKEFEQFVKTLLQLCDQICIPNVISDFKIFYGTAVPEKFFEILNKFLFMCPTESMKEMSKKFVSSSFIRIALDTKAHYFGKPSSNALQSSVNRFLEIICCRLSSPDMQQNLKSIFFSRLHNVNGSTQELLQVLKQNNTGDEALKETQECIVVLFWLAYLHGDRLVTTSQLLHALSNFLVLNPACYERSVIIPRCLTQLYVTELHRHGNRTNNSPLLQSAANILADSITKYVGNMDMVYFHDIVFVEWVMEVEELNPILRKEILGLWFSHKEENDLSVRELDLWKGIVERSATTLLLLASILGTGEEHAQYEILCILHHVLKASPVESKAVANTVRELKITLQKLFLNQAVDPLTDKNMKSVLKLLGLLVTFSPKGPLDDDFMKLVYHVVNLIKRPGGYQEELSTECLNFLNASMVHERNCGSHQVLRFLLKHHDYNKFLESVIDSFADAMDVETSPKYTTLAAVLISISYLARFQRVFTIITDDELEINLEVVMSLLCHSTRPLLRFAANIFWSSILQTDESNTYVSLTTKVSHNTGNSEQKLHKIHLRMILVHLQNSLLHGNPLVQLSALRCLESLLSCGKNVKDLLQNPWNSVMLREVKDMASSNGITLISLNLHSLFLHHERTKAVNLDVPVKDLLQVALRHFSEIEITVNTDSVKWLLAYARFFCEVIQRKSDELTVLEKTNLRCHVQRMIDSYPEAEVSMNENEDNFVYVQGVLIHDELLQENRNDPLQALRELLALLK